MIVYYIENIENNKVYIGRTIQNLGNRMSQHKHALTGNKKFANDLLQNDWDRYGEESFEFGILENGFETIDELNDAEIFWIMVLGTYDRKCGYNLRIGHHGSPQRESTKKKLSVSKSSPVLQYNLDGELIGLYGSAKTATLSTNGCYEAIRKSINSEYRLSGNCRWLKLKEPVLFNIGKQKTIKEIQRSKQAKKVYQYDLDGNFVKEWKHCYEASKNLNIHPVTIKRVCNNKDDTVKGCDFKFEKT